ncbi:4-alpha-glucanotransferase (amylomaltase) [Roseibacterium elongatum DSM 19469]|uniref:4-alpha-glucanotransferase n=1 Tax=Roseicyclus elongatus DSM 19469 TaxID=1294273 RepID=W8RTK0_9RHOB|nr:4-alpha-glucanotransferase [Roseibacterium elongatum]AHM04544.1 4-alpha-glucanotransferase (amylomaltase) [Roseibacterium elongatum DSM 19469]
MADALSALAKRAGIIPSYTDQTGRRRRTGKATMRALLAAMGLPVRNEAEAAGHLAGLEAETAARTLPHWVVGVPDTALRGVLPEDAVWFLEREDGRTAEGRGDTVPALPLGLHDLHVGGARCSVIVAPARLAAPPRAWGLMAPLHAMRPAVLGGLADYEDLAIAAEGLARQGAAFLGLNPIHAGFFADPAGFSPYTPSHRRRLSAFHLGDGTSPAPSGALIDYGVEIPRRRAALQAAFAVFQSAGGDADFDAFRRDEGAPLARFALHQALSDRHGAYWAEWPAALQDPASDVVARAGAEMAEAVTFHAWLQWRARNDLMAANRRARAAGMGLGLYLDLAVGTHPAGAETWEDRDSFAFGASLGAPPDAFSADGQSWGLAPFNPRALVAKGFRPLAETLRCQMALSGAVRIDHILGFDRAFWVPEGAPGAYVQMPRDAMLAVVRLEAARAGAVVVGEDLGNVPRGLRAALAASGIQSCRLQLFEQMPGDAPVFRAPERFEPKSIASFSTHDLPTWKGWRQGHEIETRRDLGHVTPAFADRELARRKDEVAAFDAMTAKVAPKGTDPASVDAMHHALGATRSALAMVQVECALDVVPQPNLPGTTTQYPNWRQRLPVGAADLGRDPRIAHAARIMAAHKR